MSSVNHTVEKSWDLSSHRAVLIIKQSHSRIGLIILYLNPCTDLPEMILQRQRISHSTALDIEAILFAFPVEPFDDTPLEGAS